jgi:hypothetical protein
MVVNAIDWACNAKRKTIAGARRKISMEDITS